MWISLYEQPHWKNELVSFRFLSISILFQETATISPAENNDEEETVGVNGEEEEKEEETPDKDEEEKEETVRYL